MKSVLISTAALAMSLSSFANSFNRGSDSFVYHGQERQQSLRLVDQQMVWVTETRQVRSTCTRQEPHQVRVCRSNGNPPPRRGWDDDGRRRRRRRRGDVDRPGRRRRVEERRGRGGRRAGPPPASRRCRYETRYRTVSYSCMRPQQVRVQRPGQRFTANVNFNFKNLSRYGRPEAEFLGTLNRRNFQLDVNDFGGYRGHLYLAKDQGSTHHGRNKNINYKVLVVDKQEFLKPFQGPFKIRPNLNNGVLKLVTGTIELTRGLKVTLDISDYSGRLITSHVLHGRDLNVTPHRRNPNKSITRIDLNNLVSQRDMRDGLDVTVTFQLKDKFQVLNSRDLDGAQLLLTTRQFLQL